jgi:hypothetical protein
LRTLSELTRLPRRSALYPELARALAAAERLHVLRSDLEPVPVRPTSTTSQAGCYRLREGDPVDLRVSRLHGRVALSFLHELGHFVDHQLGARLGPSWASGAHALLADWRAAAAELPSRAPVEAGRSRRRYFDSRKEVWARCYAQTVLARCGDPWLEQRLNELLDQDDAFVWPAPVLESASAELERALARLGLRPALVAAA